MTDLANQFIRSHFGLGSSTRGMTMDEANKGRSEAEARAERAAKLKVRCKQGEVFGGASHEKRVFRESREQYHAAMASAKEALLSAEIDPDAIEDFNNLTADMDAHWRCDPRAED